MDFVGLKKEIDQDHYQREAAGSDGECALMSGQAVPCTHAEQTGARNCQPEFNDLPLVCSPNRGVLFFNEITVFLYRALVFY